MRPCFWQNVELLLPIVMTEGESDMAFLRDKNGNIVGSISTTQSCAGAADISYRHRKPEPEATSAQKIETPIQRLSREIAARKTEPERVPGEREGLKQVERNQSGIRAYIVAHVAFDKSGKTYPVNCFRTDITVGDEVVVKMNNRPLKWARVDDVNYLNWGCQNTIECLASEAQFTANGIVLPAGGSLSIKGLARPYELAVRLFKMGWVSRRTASKMYRMAYSATNKTQTALILMRKNGIDVQIIDGLPAEKVKPNSVLSISREDGPFVGQPFHGSLHNILERTALFGEAFLRDATCLEEMIAPLQTTKVLPSPPSRMGSKNDDLYTALGGSGEPIYLSDGVWLT